MLRCKHRNVLLNIQGVVIVYYSALLKLFICLALIFGLKIEQECWCVMKFEETEFKLRKKNRLVRGRLETYFQARKMCPYVLLGPERIEK